MDSCPLLKPQFQEVGEPVDWSVKVTTSGAHPEVLLAVKSATGTWAMAEYPEAMSNINTTTNLC